MYFSGTDSANLYTSSVAEVQNSYPFLWATDTDIWNGMLNLATADLGMFFFDEYNVFQYENGSKLFDTVYLQHADVQWTINDDDYIVSGTENLELNVNKITCKIYSTITNDGWDVILWTAQSGETLSVTQTLEAVGRYDTEIMYKTMSSSEDSDEIYSPVLASSGYVKIDNEIIQYESVDQEYIRGCTRGVFDTVSASHTAYTAFYEVRAYDLVFNEKPIFFVKPPYLQAERDGEAIIERWDANSNGGQIIVSAYRPDSYSVPSYVYLEGTEITTGINHYFHISGIKVRVPEATTDAESLSEEFASEIRKHDEKSLDIDNQFIFTKKQAQEIMDFLITHFKDGVSVITVQTMGLPHLQLGDRIKIGSFDALDIFNVEFWVTQIDLNYDGGIQQTMVLREVS